jgi:hypothetical protein
LKAHCLNPPSLHRHYHVCRSQQRWHVRRHDQRPPPRLPLRAARSGAALLLHFLLKIQHTPCLVAGWLLLLPSFSFFW